MTRWFPDGMPQPMSDNDSLPWWRAAAEHRFTVQRCTDCSHLRLPAAPLCPSCRSFASDWMEVPGRGHLYTYTIVHRPIAPDQTVPFVVAVVELEGAPGVRIISSSGVRITAAICSAMRGAASVASSTGQAIQLKPASAARCSSVAVR